MEADDSGELFIADIVAPMIEHVQNPQNDDVTNVKDFDNDASAFATETMDSLSVLDISGNLTAKPEYKTAVEVTNESTKNSVNSQNLLPRIAPLPSRAETPLLKELAVLSLQNTKGVLHYQAKEDY